MRSQKFASPSCRFLFQRMFILFFQFFHSWPLDDCKIWHLSSSNFNLLSRLTIQNVDCNFIYKDSWRVGLNFNFITASPHRLIYSKVPTGSSVYAQKTKPCASSGMMAGNGFSSLGTYPAKTVLCWRIISSSWRTPYAFGKRANHITRFPPVILLTIKTMGFRSFFLLSIHSLSYVPSPIYS